MSGFLRITGAFLRDSSKTHILSRDIVHEARAQINTMPAHIPQASALHDDVTAKVIAERQNDADRAGQYLEQRLKALVFAMGDHRALDTADVTVTRLEGAWQLHLESHRDLATKYDDLVHKIRALDHKTAPYVATPTADDVIEIIKNLDQRWYLMSERMASVTGALELNNKHLQSLAKFFGLGRPLQTGSNILDIIRDKWVQSNSLVSELSSCLTIEKEKNSLADDTIKGLASFMDVDPTDCEATLVGSIMDRWVESKREVNDLQRALLKEKEKAKEAQKALQAHLNRPVALTSSASTQTDDLQPLSRDLGQVVDKAVQTVKMESSPPLTPNGHVLLRQCATFELKPLASQHRGDIVEPDLEDPWSNDSQRSILLQSPYQWQDLGLGYQVPLSTQGGIPVKFSRGDNAVGSVSGGTSFATSNVLGTSKRSCPHDRYVDRDLQRMKEHPAMSISSRGSSQCRSFTSSTGSDRIQLDPWHRSLESIRMDTTISPPSKASLINAFPVTPGAESHPEESATSSNIKITKLSDLVSWDEYRPRIELGSGVAGTVYLYRHEESKRPVAVKVVENPGQCFRNEVRIHQAISGLPWFPLFYGSFDIAGNQAILAMEFLGGDSDDKSYTVADCLENTGPILTRDEWFDIFNDVAQGLKSLHDSGFLSNDLKEDNVMLVKESGIWRAKIIDFGWASDISANFVMDLDEEQIENYRQHGGCRQNAPECVLEAKPCSTSSDVYALGRLMAFVGQEMEYDDFLSYGQGIYYADQDQRPTVEEFLDELYNMQLVGGGEDGPGSSSC